MINKRLIGVVAESKKYVAAGVAFQWASLAANVLLTGAVCRLLAALWAGTATPADLLKLGALAAALVLAGCAVAQLVMLWKSAGFFRDLPPLYAPLPPGEENAGL